MTEHVVADQVDIDLTGMCMQLLCRCPGDAGDNVGDIADADVRRQADGRERRADRIRVGGVDDDRARLGEADRLHEFVIQGEMHRQPRSELRLIQLLESFRRDIHDRPRRLDRSAHEDQIRLDAADLGRRAIDVGKIEREWFHVAEVTEVRRRELGEVGEARGPLQRTTRHDEVDWLVPSSEKVRQPDRDVADADQQQLRCLLCTRS